MRDHLKHTHTYVCAYLNYLYIYYIYTYILNSSDQVVYYSHF